MRATGETEGGGRLKCLCDSVSAARKVWVVLHNSPDPDAMAAGMVLKSVLQNRCGAEVSIVYAGIIGRPDNRIMQERLRIKMEHMSTVDAGPEDVFISVDTQPSFTNNSLPENAAVAAVIDHHPESENIRAAHVDIRPEVGAVTTIAMEYYGAAGLELNRRIATAVAYAIISETQDLGRSVSSADLRTYMSVLERADHVLIGQMRHPRVERRFFRTLAAALQSAELCESAIICHLQRVHAPDELARVADILNPLAGASWVLCTGQHDTTMLLNIRSSDPDAVADRVMDRVLGGRGSGGGHDMMAGGHIEFEGEEDASEVRQGVTERFLEALGVDRDASIGPLLDPPPEEMIPSD
ncbi:MAG: DHH family phosphoesterase [Candidatus Brocadiia bacterium]